MRLLIRSALRSRCEYLVVHCVGRVTLFGRPERGGYAFQDFSGVATPTCPGSNIVGLALRKTSIRLLWLIFAYPFPFALPFLFFIYS